jgi:hypothetical protein
MVKMLTLWSHLKLLKNLGALSEYAKCSQRSTKKKLKSLFLTLYPGYDGNGKKTISRYCPFNDGVAHGLPLLKPLRVFSPQKQKA